MAQSCHPDSPDNLSDDEAADKVDPRLVKLILQNPDKDHEPTAQTRTTTHLGNTTDINAKVSLHLDLPLISNAFARRIGLIPQLSQYSQAKSVLRTYEIEGKYRVSVKRKDATSQKWLNLSFFGTEDIGPYDALLTNKINEKWGLVQLAEYLRAESASPEPPESAGQVVTAVPVTISERS
jgi:hypothetical protein